MNNCLSCEKETNNPKFCNRQCFHDYCKGKTYEELYGKEKAKKLRELVKLQTIERKKDKNICKFCRKIFYRNYSKTFCTLKCFQQWLKGKPLEKRLKNVKDIKLYKLHLAEATTKTWKNPNRARNFGKMYGLFESPAHKNLKQISALVLNKQGYETYFETLIWVGNYFRVVDVFGIKKDEKVAVECGGVSQRKINEYKKIFQWIIHIPYKGEIKYIRGLLF